VFNQARVLLSAVAWADNADACSKQYAGTGALKTDFTRYGTLFFAAIFVVAAWWCSA